MNVDFYADYWDQNMKIMFQIENPELVSEALVTLMKGDERNASSASLNPQKLKTQLQIYSMAAYVFCFFDLYFSCL